MVGRPVSLSRDVPAQEPGASELIIDNLRVIGDRGTEAVAGVSISVRRGEIVGIAGVSGNGQRELAEAIFGLRPIESGSITVSGQEISTPAPSKIRKLGLAYVPEERMRDGAIGDFTVAENLMLVAYRSNPFTKRGMLNRSAIAERCRQLVQGYKVKTPTIHTPTRHLSGGNIQKVVIAREFSSEASVLVVAQPTRGVDIGAAEYIHERLLDQRSQGSAILIISEDLDEVMQLSDRIVVLLEGKIMGEVERGKGSVRDIGLLMSGVTT
jgi:simple sugar transport system ATP-binding protein